MTLGWSRAPISTSLGAFRKIVVAWGALMRSDSLRALAISAALALVAPEARAESDPGKGAWSAAVYGGRFFDNKWPDFFSEPDSLESVDAWMVGVAVSREIGRWPAPIQWEIEGQIVRHFGEQDHWEVNVPLIARWTEFTWNETLETGVAFGMGPSYAFSEPKAERARSGETSQFMLYWTIEASVAAPGSPWSAVVRLHHRSTAYGVFGEAGGSNILAFGLRRRF